jgi:hypothetical protein
MKAFPNLQIVVSDMGNVRAVTQSDSGMDLRDYFAGLAMQEVTWKKGEEKEDAKDCYVVADAMMKAREK